MSRIDCEILEYCQDGFYSKTMTGGRNLPMGRNWKGKREI